MLSIIYDIQIPAIKHHKIHYSYEVYISVGISLNELRGSDVEVFRIYIGVAILRAKPVSAAQEV